MPIADTVARLEDRIFSWIEGRGGNTPLIFSNNCDLPHAGVDPGAPCHPGAGLSGAGLDAATGLLQPPLRRTWIALMRRLKTAVVGRWNALSAIWGPSEFELLESLSWPPLGPRQTLEPFVIPFSPPGRASPMTDDQVEIRNLRQERDTLRAAYGNCQSDLAMAQGRKDPDVTAWADGLIRSLPRKFVEALTWELENRLAVQRGSGDHA